MCGICGIYTEHGEAPDLLRDGASRMAAALIHRGPDDAGGWTDGTGRVALANQRLAIIDLSPAGHQPITDPRGEIVLTFNGMIYNYRELRRELVQTGYPFRGHSDTEVIVALYLRDGLDMVPRLRGMFAFALWDSRTRTLVLARDRLGIKPLYYAHWDGRWLFASEIRAIRASGLFPVRVDPAALAAYLRLGSVPAPLTAFEGVSELPPASVLTVVDGRAAVRPYWRLPASDTERAHITGTGRELRERLRDAVATHLISDVPVGVFLSGGVDSGAIVGLMREAGHARIRTFSITFPEAAFDEGALAARVAARYETDHTASEVRGSDLAADLDRIVTAMDQPTVDGINTYYVSQVTRRSGTIVALSGLGGDELFGGYPSFRLIPRLLAWQRAVSRVGVVRPVLAAALAAVPSARSAKLKESLSRSPDIRSAYLAVRGVLSADELSGLLAPGPLRDALRTLDPAAAIGALAPELPGDPVSATRVLELRGYMHNQLLRDTDVMSMAHSLEVRVPFLDHHVVEFAAGLPLRLQANGHPPKRLLREAVGDLLLPEADRAKQGFTFPIGLWLRGPLRLRVEDALQGVRLFQPAAVARLWRQLQTGRAHWSRIWAPTVLALWLRANGGADSW